MGNENKLNLKIYRAFYQDMSETISCVIVFINEDRQICISNKINDLVIINGILSFMIEKEISELEELSHTENLERFINNILMEYSNSSWKDKKDVFINILFDYLNGMYLNEINYKSTK